jgi:integrase/recombinase XerD
VLEELKLRNYSQATSHAYVEGIRRFAEYFHHSPEQLGPEDIRQYQLHLIEERKLKPKSVMMQMAALRFLYLKVLRRSYSRDDLPLPRTPRHQFPSYSALVRFGGSSTPHPISATCPFDVQVLARRPTVT